MDSLVSNLDSWSLSPNNIATPPDPIELDGTYCEGGGQLLRTAVCLSALTGKPVRINDIRGKRKGGGGLKAQHLASVKWLARACSARVTGAEIGSENLLFEPGQGPASEEVFTRSRDDGGDEIYEASVEVGTAGSTGLVLQAVLPFILFSHRVPFDRPINLTLSGGTNVGGSPSFEYISHILLPTLRNIGFPDMKTKLVRRGWSNGSRDPGCFRLEIPARKARRGLKAFHMAQKVDTTGPVQPLKLTATFIAPTDTHQHFERVLHAATQHFFSNKIDTDIIFCDTGRNKKRLYLILAAELPVPVSNTPHFIATDFLYERKAAVSNSTVTSITESVVQNLHGDWETGGRVDGHLFDQLVIFRALAEGRSEIFPGQQRESADDSGRGWRESTDHTKTAQWVCERILGVQFDDKGRCDGVGFGRAPVPKT